MPKAIGFVLSTLCLAREPWPCSTILGPSFPYPKSNGVIPAVTQGGNTLHWPFLETAFGQQLPSSRICSPQWADGAGGSLFTGLHARHLFGLAFQLKGDLSLAKQFCGSGTGFITVQVFGQHWFLYLLPGTLWQREHDQSSKETRC